MAASIGVRETVTRSMLREGREHALHGMDHAFSRYRDVTQAFFDALIHRKDSVGECLEDMAESIATLMRQRASRFELFAREIVPLQQGEQLLSDALCIECISKEFEAVIKELFGSGIIEMSERRMCWGAAPTYSPQAASSVALRGIKEGLLRLDKRIENKTRALLWTEDQKASVDDAIDFLKSLGAQQSELNGRRLWQAIA